MKHKSQLLWAAFLAAAIGILLPIFSPAPANAQSTLVFPTRTSVAGFTLNTLGGLQATTANSATSNPTNAIAGVNDGGFAITTSFTGSNSSDTGNVTYTFYPSLDGTNFASAGALTFAVASNGTNTVIGFTNFAAANVGNARYVQLYSIANAAGHTITNNNVWVGQYAR